MLLLLLHVLVKMTWLKLQIASKRMKRRLRIWLYLPKIVIFPTVVT